MKKLKYVMVEHIGDYGEWIWFIVKKNTTPKQALKDYMREMDFDEKENIVKITEGDEKGMWYLENEQARAFEITVY